MFGISVQKNESEINFAYINLSSGVISFYSGGENVRQTDMEFVKNFTPSDFRLKILHRQFLIFNSFSKKKTQKMSES